MRGAATRALGAKRRGTRRTASARGRIVAPAAIGSRATTTSTSPPTRALSAASRPGDVRRGEPAEHEREAAQQQRAAAPAHDGPRAASGSSSADARAPPSTGAATSRPPWRSAISAAIARPRPRRPRPPRARRVSSATGAGRPGALVDDLDAHVAAADRARGQLDAAGPVLERVGDEVRDRLAEAQAIAVDERARAAAAASRDRAVERARDDVPALELLLEQLGDLDGLGAVDDPPAAARGGEVVEREAGAAQLEVERREALGRRLEAALHRGEAEAHRGQRPAQLVAGARHQLAPAAQLERRRSASGEPDRRRAQASVTSTSARPPLLSSFVMTRVLPRGCDGCAPQRARTP